MPVGHGTHGKREPVGSERTLGAAVTGPRTCRTASLQWTACVFSAQVCLKKRKDSEGSGFTAAKAPVRGRVWREVCRPGKDFPFCPLRVEAPEWGSWVQ